MNTVAPLQARRPRRTAKIDTSCMEDVKRRWGAAAHAVGLTEAALLHMVVVKYLTDNGIADPGRNTEMDDPQRRLAVA